MKEWSYIFLVVNLKVFFFNVGKDQLLYDLGVHWKDLENQTIVEKKVSNDLYFRVGVAESLITY